MKKLLVLIIMSIVTVSCYEDYIHDFDYSGVFFSYQKDVRSFIVGEGMKIKVGVAMGGVRENKIDRNVNFILDNSLITPELLASMKAASEPYIKSTATAVAALEPLPESYYNLSNTNTMVIKAGMHSGSVEITPDSVNFLNDSLKTMHATYILPFYIMEADADSIIETKRHETVGIRFENMLFGNYYHGGAAVINRPAKSDTTICYSLKIPAASEAQVWLLTTVGPNTLNTNAYYKANSSATKQLRLVLKGTRIYVSSAPGSTYTFIEDGVSTYNKPKLLQDRMLILKYRYTDPVSPFWTYHCTDTLKFRNRIRDGINEWYDENPSHYN
jgi:hypothetical protein